MIDVAIIRAAIADPSFLSRRTQAPAVGAPLRRRPVRRQRLVIGPQAVAAWANGTAIAGDLLEAAR